jgi:hypothetical protein
MSAITLPVCSMPAQASDSGALPLASWSRAIEIFNSKLTKDERKKIKLEDDMSGRFEDVLAAAQAAQRDVERRRLKSTPTLLSIFTIINRYAVAGDLIMQHHAEYTSLVWGAFRFLLQVGHPIRPSCLMLTFSVCSGRGKHVGEALQSA